MTSRRCKPGADDVLVSREVATQLQNSERSDLAVSEDSTDSGKRVNPDVNDIAISTFKILIGLYASLIECRRNNQVATASCSEVECRNAVSEARHYSIFT